MYSHIVIPEDPDYRWVPGRCPNAGNACNCPGWCHPIRVRRDDPRSDEQIRQDTREIRVKGWSSQSLRVYDEGHIVRGEN